MTDALFDFKHSVEGTAARWPLLSLIPHDLPMSLLDEVVSVSDQALLAKVNIHAHSVFVESGGVPSLVGIEYMAQAIAAFAGHKALSEGHAVALGFLVGTRKYRSSGAYFPVGSTLWIRVEQVLVGDNGLSVFECAIKGVDIEVSANLNVFQPEDPEQFLAQSAHQ